MSMKEEKLKEAAKLNQLKYVFSEEVNKATISELKTIGIGNFVDGANWMKEQLSQSEVTKISEQVPSLLDLKLMDCPLSVRTLNALRLWDKPTKDITLKDLVGCTKKELLGARNFGNTMLIEVEDFLTGYGLKLKGE